MSLKLIVEGRLSRTVLITGMHANVLARHPPLTGTVLCAPSQGLGINAVIAFDLDAPGAPARQVDPGALSFEMGRPFFADRHVELANEEKQVFQIYAFAHALFYEWEIAIELIVDGVERQTVARLDGNPLKLSGHSQNYAAVYSFSDINSDRPVIGGGWQLYPESHEC